MRDKTQAVTELPLSPEQERHSRMVKYSITMGIRMVCLGACGFAAVAPGWWVLFPALGAIFLPFFAVMIANNVQSGATQRVMRPGAIVPLSRPRHEGGQ